MSTDEVTESTKEKLPADIYRQVGIYFRRTYRKDSPASKEFFCTLGKRTLKGDTIGEVRAKIDLAFIERPVNPSE